jgi:hypothetical protein
MYEIEKGIPIPTFGNNAKYPLGAMEIGDSFACPDSEKHRVRCAITQYLRTHGGLKFSTRLDKAAKTIRVWRVE